MKTKIIIAFMLLLSVGLTAYAQKGAQTYTHENPYEVKKLVSPQGEEAKNVIVMIGDGMGPVQAYSAWVANRGKLNLDNCPVVGLSRTYCVDRLVTDSGAGGTAIAIGQKTNYLSIGVDAEGNEVPSLLDLAREKGKSTGVAVTCILYDATPSDFCCHNTSRYETDDLVADYVDCEVDYIIGGAAKNFRERKDGRNILKEMAEKGYQTASSWEEVEKVKSGRLVAPIFEVDAPDAVDRGDYLPNAAMKGIELLSQNKNGFAMMIEGSRIDDFGHNNQTGKLIQEVHDFDRTIGAVLEWAAQDGETLVVILADHETGGMTLVGGDLSKGEVQCDFSTGGHTGVFVPVYAFGPGSQHFTGVFENSDVLGKILKVMK